MLLADLGADVIIVEPLTGGDPARDAGGATAPGETGEFFRTFNRNKRSLALNLKHPSGQDVLHRLLTTSDVLLEGFRPGVAHRLGIGRAAIAVRHPHLVYASISGYGQSGADSNVTGHDLSYVSRAAIVAPKVPLPDGSEFILPLADLTAGALTAVGVLAAIFGRQHGRAQYLDVSLSESVLSWVAPLLEMHLNDATVEAMREPAYGTFRCGDGRDITLSVAFEDHFWNALCTELGLVNLEHLRSSERRRRTAELRASIERRLSTDSAASWVSRLAAAARTPSDQSLTSRASSTIVTSSSARCTAARRAAVTASARSSPTRSSPSTNGSASTDLRPSSASTTARSSPSWG